MECYDKSDPNPRTLYRNGEVGTGTTPNPRTLYRDGVLGQEWHQTQDIVQGCGSWDRSDPNPQNIVPVLRSATSGVSHHEPTLINVLFSAHYRTPQINALLMASVPFAHTDPTRGGGPRTNSPFAPRVTKFRWEGQSPSEAVPAQPLAPGAQPGGPARVWQRQPRPACPR